jgi:hypothetical protein
VELAPAVTDVGLKVAVAPVGSPVADSETVCAVPDTTVVDTAVETEEPCVAEPDVGEVEMEKSLVATGFTVSEKVAVWLVDPEVPVIVIVEVPVGVDDVVASVNVELLPADTEAGLNVAVVPAGRPEADSVTVPVNPPMAVVDTVVVVEAPTVTEPEDGESEMEKSGVLLFSATSSYFVYVGSAE